MGFSMSVEVFAPSLEASLLRGGRNQADPSENPRYSEAHPGVWRASSHPCFLSSCLSPGHGMCSLMVVFLKGRQNRINSYA